MKIREHDPWFRTRLSLGALGVRLELWVPHDVFSTARVDEGTVLLLDHLPASAPRSVLDLGCGYGALGLPIAARHPQARVEMVDRDLLAVAWAAGNAAENHLPNALVHGSLGYRALAPGGPPYDWILCNVPARIGRPFIEHVFAAGRALLAPSGEVRVVVIRDLAPVIEALRVEHGWPLLEQARGPRHAVFALAAAPDASPPVSEPAEPAALYVRDEVEIGGLRLERPFDLGGDEPRRLASGLPLLLEALPRQPPARVLCFRCGYGTLPLVARSRWPGAQVVAVDRDLLATSFTRRNAERLGLAQGRLEVREAAHFPDAVLTSDSSPAASDGGGSRRVRCDTPLSLDPSPRRGEGWEGGESAERFDLALGELSPSAGERVAAAEFEALARILRPGGQALVLSLEKLEREWVRHIAARRRLSVHRMIARQGYSLLRLTPP